MEIVQLAKTGMQTPGAAFASPVHRIPALTVTPSGRLLAAWDVREDWRDLPGEFDIVLRTSEDSGRTWGPVRVLRQHTTGHGFGDASLLTDPATGRIHCFYTGSRGPSFFTAGPGPSTPGLEIWLAASDDDGQTWSHREVTANLKPDDVTGMFAASGAGLALTSARPAPLLQPFVLRTRTGEHYAAVARSDDQGLTWRLGQRIGPDCDESKIAQLPDGRILLHARATPQRKRAISTDDGHSFTPPVPDPTLTDPGCNGGLTRWHNLMACTMLDDPTGRRRLVLRTGNGHHWSAPTVLDAGAAGYSVATPLPDGTLGVLWEAGDYDELIFARISPADINQTQRQSSPIPRTSPGGTAKNPEVR